MRVSRKIIVSGILVMALCAILLSVGCAEADVNAKSDGGLTAPSDKDVKGALTDWAYNKHADLCLILRDKGDGTLELIGKRNVNVSIYEAGSYVEDGSYWLVKAQVSCDLGGTVMLLSPSGKFKIYKDKDGKWKAEEM